MGLQKLGKYEIASKIGEGAMGEVYKAFDPILGREVAVKTMSASIGADDELRQRFHREAQSAARLNHPNIITIHDFGEDQGRAYIAMELLEGDDLKDLITRAAPLSLEQKVALMEQMADGLAFAHVRDVVHRDLKPANIHIHRGGQVKIMDFGLARLSTSNMTRAGMVMGTPNYMSPEQVRGERATARSDVFSLGSVFYELLTYRKPFDSDSLHAVLFQVMQQEPVPLEQAVPGVPLALCELVQKAMAKDPARRFQDASELREGLRAVRNALSVASTAPGLPVTLPPSEQEAATLPAARPAVTRPASATALAMAEPTRVVEPDPSPATVALDADAPTTLAGREVTLAPAARREKIAVPVVHAPRPGSRLPWVGAAGAVAVGIAYAAFRISQGSAPSPSPSSPAASPIPPTLSSSVRVQGSVSVSSPTADHGEALAQARRSLQARDYRATVERLEPVLAGAPRNEDARRLLDEAQVALRRGEAAARELDAALDAGDAGRASTALARLQALDPRHPDLPALSVRLNEALRREALEAQRALEQARRQPPPTAPVTTMAAAPPTTAAPILPPPTTAPPATLPPVAAPVSLTAAQVEAARKTIRSVLAEYESAIETRNAEYLRRLAPGLDYEAMKANFTAVAGMDVKIDIQDVTVTGDTATADCLVTYTPNPKPVGRIRPVPTLFRLKQAGAVWVIEDVKRR
jgi:eukaryotic-like serine/threonine-protein kinase